MVFTEQNLDSGVAKIQPSDEIHLTHRRAHLGGSL